MRSKLFKISALLVMYYALSRLISYFNRPLQGNMASTLATQFPILTLEGLGGRANLAIHVAPKVRSETAPLLVFFVGDVQDFRAKMLAHRDNKAYARYSLEDTAAFLSEAMTSTRVLVVKPVKMEWGSFSRYENFVESNEVGAPEHKSEGFRATDHLRALLLSLQTQVDLGRDLDEVPKTLIGFSKGVVVLNQLLYELKSEPDSESEARERFWSSIKQISWLDGGHAGGKKTWVTDEEVLKRLAQMTLTLDVRVTPYQVRDERRPWIRQEEKRFTGILTRLGADVKRKMYLEDLEASIYNHFKVIDTLKEDPLL